MGQPRIIEIDYHDFLKVLRLATDTKKKIDKADKQAWASYVRKHNVPEGGIAVKAKAGAMSGKTKVVIIDGAGEADGYYIYAPDDLFCLKYESGVE